MSNVEVSTTKRDIHWLKMIVYGPAGVGKTVLCSTAPNPIIVSAEGGLLSLADQYIPCIEVGSLDEVKKAFKIVRDSEYTTICIDSLSEIAEVLLEEFKPQFKDKRQAYGLMAEEMIKLTRKFRDLAATHEKHVLFTAKQSKIKDEDNGIIYYEPLMPGKAYNEQLPYFFDLVLCMQADRKGNRFIQTQPDMRFTAKDRSGKLDIKEEPNLTDIINKVKAKAEGN